jgi:hypothetical protein
MSAVKAWDARTRARSMPCSAMNERAQRPANVVSSRRRDARIPWSVSVPLLPRCAARQPVGPGGSGAGRPRSGAGYTPASAPTRPSTIAVTRAWWSRSFWSAYASANSPTAVSKAGLRPR